MGSACLDYLAQVASWPNPDDKLRTESLETQGGGNCANALTAAARLGLRPTLVSKIGDDGIGEQILAQLGGDGVDTAHVVRGEDSPSPFTYIIVDREEIEPRTRDILDGAAVVYFDGRLTDAAVPLARAARRAGIPVLVEAERLRPHLETLLAEADYVTTSAKFPQAWTGEEDIGDALVGTLQRLPLASWVFTTLGARGAVMLERAPPEEALGDATLAELLPQLWQELGQPGSRGGSQPACTTDNGTHIREGTVSQSPGALRLRRSDGAGSSEAAAGRAELAAAHEAARNAGGGDAAGYRMRSARGAWQGGGGAGARDGGIGDPPTDVIARVYVASAAGIAKEDIRDTTGAGDACVGTLLYAICEGLPLPAAMRLAAVVAAAKCVGLGARATLPLRGTIRADLLR